MGDHRSNRRRSSRRRSQAASLLVGALMLASCSTVRDVRILSSDAMGGRNNGTEGSALARDHIVDRLDEFSVGLAGAPSGEGEFLHPFDRGTNVLALIPGTQLPDEYVIIGAHYDHVGTCPTDDPADRVCNGATDNATGVAAVLAVGEKLAQMRGGPKRSVILAFWDAEEDGLVGSRAYVNDPVVPLAQTVAYVNLDIQGANLLPSLRTTTFAVGAETGGERLMSAVAAATDRGLLDTLMLSSTFGQSRSDYVNFINNRVPTVFFSDSTGPCYHTAQDDVTVVDFLKLALQIHDTTRLAHDLVQGERPTFTPGTPLASYDDAVAMQAVGQLAVADLDRFTAADRARLETIRSNIDRIVAEGPAAFGADDTITVLTGALTSIGIFSAGECDGFTTPEPGR